MKLSVLIPNYNGSKTLLSVIKSVIEQLPDDSEVILLDDCSTDASIDLVKSTFPGVKIIENSINRGAAAVRNIGLKHAQGEYLLFIDSDVIVDSGCIASLLDTSEGVDVIFPRIVYPNGELMYPINKLQASYLLISPIFILRKESLNHMVEPFFDETYGTYCEDTDFFLRAFLAGLVSKFQSNTNAIHVVNFRSGNREARYFLEMRNAIYGAVKFLGIKNIDQFDHAFKFSNIMKVLLCGIFNFNLFDMQARGYKKGNGLKDNLTYLFHRNNSITSRGSFILLVLSFKAVLWNLKRFSTSLAARRCVIHQANQLPAGNENG